MNDFTKEGGVITALTAPTLRLLILKINSHKIKRENIVSLLKEDNMFVLVYYNYGEVD